MRKLKQLILAVVIFMTCGVAFAINFNPVHQYPQFVSWEVEGSATQPIEFPRGETKNMYFCATAPCDISDLDIRIEITTMGVTHAVSLPKESKGYLHNCELPFKEGDVLYVQLPIKISTTAPLISSQFTIKLSNEVKKPIAGGSCDFYITK